MADPLKQILAMFGAAVGIILTVSIVFGLVLPAINNSFAPKQCPTCDYSTFQNNISNCAILVSNLTNQLNETPIRYIQNVTYVNVTKVMEKAVYIDRPVPIALTVMAFIFSFVVTIKLFKVEIKLPKELEEELKKLESWIKGVKWLSFVVSVLILLRLIWILFSLL